MCAVASGVGGPNELILCLLTGTGASFSVSVCLRLKPKSKDPIALVAQRTSKLPLHQRLRMIQAKEGCTAKEARRILWHGEP